MSIFGAACGTVAHDAPRGRSGERRPALGPLAPGFDGNCLTTSGDAAQRTLPSGSDTRFTSTTRGRPDDRGGSGRLRGEGKQALASIPTLTDAKRAERRRPCPAQRAEPLAPMHPENKAASGGPSSAAPAGFDGAYPTTSGDAACNGRCPAVQSGRSNPSRAAVLTTEGRSGRLQGEEEQTLTSIPTPAEAAQAERRRPSPG